MKAKTAQPFTALQDSPGLYKPAKVVSSDEVLKLARDILAARCARGATLESPNDVRHEYAGRMAETMEQLFAWFEAGRLNPRVSHTFALDDFQDAMAEVLGRRSIGRIALVMDEEARRLGK